MKHPQVPVSEFHVDPAWLTATRATLQPFHDLLATDGLVRGVIGPREEERLWPRHLLNCAAVADPSIELIAGNARVVDIGSGGGLPGLVWSLVRPDLQLILVEPLQRRVAFLLEAAERLGIEDRVAVMPVRAQDAGTGLGDVVGSRALSSLVDIMEWSTPLLRPGGSILAMKGARAETELHDAHDTMQRMGITGEVLRIGPEQDDGHPWATVVRGWIDG